MNVKKIGKNLEDVSLLVVDNITTATASNFNGNSDSKERFYHCGVCNKLLGSSWVQLRSELGFILSRQVSDWEKVYSLYFKDENTNSIVDTFGNENENKNDNNSKTKIIIGIF